MKDRTADKFAVTNGMDHIIIRFNGGEGYIGGFTAYIAVEDANQFTAEIRMAKESLSGLKEGRRR